MSLRACPSCGGAVPARRRKYCGEDCRRQVGVYRFVCPDGRSYVGSTHNLRIRPVNGLQRSNRRIAAALAKYPAETWRFEVLERLPPGRPFLEAIAAERRHIERLGTLNPEQGFNMRLAVPSRVRGVAGSSA
jgi:hypothetical protein